MPDEKNSTPKGQGCCAGTKNCSEMGSSPEPSCCPGNIKDAPWITGMINTPAGLVPRVAARLSFRDTRGTWKVRWDIGRMNYSVAPGLYAVGNPEPDAPVLVSANYKMSFDRLRHELAGLNLWILVLDTKGINVWCAAGKGTFGTAELVRRITMSRLPEVVTGRTLILPQLGAPGVAAHEVFKATGFKVIYGPVRANDIPRYLQAKNKATPAMREVRFGFLDRLILTPVEIAGVIKPALLLLVILFVMNLIFNGGGVSTRSFYQLAAATGLAFIPYLGALVCGAVLVPVLLPYLPGRAFSWKGWLLGLAWAGVYSWLTFSGAGWKGAVLYLLLLPPITSYLAMNFTGASTYTSLSGVVREMKIALPAQIVSAGLGVIWLIGRLWINI